jgi:hypothetical protein
MIKTELKAITIPELKNIVFEKKKSVKNCSKVFNLSRKGGAVTK